MSKNDLIFLDPGEVLTLFHNIIKPMLFGLQGRDSPQSLSGQVEQNTRKSVEGPDGKNRSPTFKPETRKTPYFGKTLYSPLLNDYLANRFMR